MEINIDLNLKNFNESYNSIIVNLNNISYWDNVFVTTKTLNINNKLINNNILYIEPSMLYVDKNGFNSRYNLIGLFRVLNQTQNNVWKKELLPEEIKLYSLNNNKLDKQIYSPLYYK